MWPSDGIAGSKEFDGEVFLARVDGYLKEIWGFA